MLLLNDKPIEHFVFSGGEIQIQLPKIITPERVVLTWKPINSSEIMLLQLAVNSLKHKGLTDIDLDVLYLPYARQDRVCSPGQALSLEVICEILNGLDVRFIRFWDVHNPEAMAEYLSEFRMANITVADIFKRYNLEDKFDLDSTILCAPDEGADERVETLMFRTDFSNAIGLIKERCPETGKILGIRERDMIFDYTGSKVLIVDDICDGGATFNQAAQLLREKGAAELYLYVTHGIFSKGLDLLLENFKHIYCHHVLHNDKYQSTDRLTILREFPHVS